MPRPYLVWWCSVFAPAPTFAASWTRCDWAHLCTVNPERIDPLHTVGITPDRPPPYWGWGAIPDQYGRTWDGDDGETPPPPDPSWPTYRPFTPAGDRATDRPSACGWFCSTIPRWMLSGLRSVTASTWRTPSTPYVTPWLLRRSPRTRSATSSSVPTGPETCSK